MLEELLIPVVSSKKFKLNDQAPRNEELIHVSLPKFRMEISWTPDQKAKALDLLKVKSVIQVYHHFEQKIAYKTLRTWKSHKRSERKRGSGRNPASEELDERMFEWFLDARALKFSVDNKTLTMKAQSLKDEILEELDKENDKDKIFILNSLKFGKNWLSKFKKRKNINARMVNTLCKKSYSYFEVKLSSFYSAFDLIKDNFRFFFNMDETAVYFELNYKQTLTVKGEEHVGIISGGKDRQRVTVILTIGYCPFRSNYQISKIPPILIFKKSKPRNSTLLRPASDLVEDQALNSLANKKRSPFITKL